MYVSDTIAAISTPAGEGGIGIVRLSGPEALPVASRIFRRNRDGGLHSHRFYYGEIVDPSGGSCLDEVLLVWMKAPRSYTREDVVEIHCHGGTLVVQQLLSLVLAQGVRLAQPGEFTRRAFLNGRLDLVQAEAVIDIIRGKTEAALDLAQHQREGLLSRALFGVREQLQHALALVEAYIDFPEEDLGDTAGAELSGLSTAAATELSRLLASYREGRVLRDGVSVVIAGKPNVGKSSLLNVLLKEKRAIVTAVPGTTRDVIEEVVNLHGLPVTLLDTAGIREADDEVEQEGVRLTLERLPRADLVIFLLDGSRPFDDDDRQVLAALSNLPRLVVVNKADLSQQLILPAELKEPAPMTIATATGAGLDVLKQAIHDTFLHGRAVDSREFVAISQARHRDALVKALAALDRFVAALELASPPELLSVELREALAAVGEVTGETTADDVLDLIFNRFCIGK
ncbi:MAG TPA: tRNA uridine-5-carboxymethylaminomethyl(34) synthesis GTPase MnmE [Geobacteraceae bacterium]